MECTLHGGECSLDEEILVLEAIYINELSVLRAANGHVSEIRLLLHPATADETDRQFVKITLVIKPSVDYPDKLPDIKIDNSRGLSDSQIKCLSESLNLHAQDKRGWPMLHELIETAKDTLTAGNLPHCPCSICLDHFTGDDDIHKTICYHYYHQECLTEYMEYYKRTVEEASNDRTIPCPICREEIEVDVQGSGKKKTEFRENSDYVPDAYVKALQEKMQSLYMKQKERGGIIDVEAEKNKFLVQNGTVVVPQEFVQDTDDRLQELMSQSNQGAHAVDPRNQRSKFVDNSRADNRRSHNSRRGRNLHSAARDTETRKLETRPKPKSDERTRWSDTRNEGSARRNTRVKDPYPRYENGESSNSERRPPRPRPDSRKNVVRGNDETVRDKKGVSADTTATNCDKVRPDNQSTGSKPEQRVNSESATASRDRRQRRQNESEKDKDRSPKAGQNQRPRQRANNGSTPSRGGAVASGGSSASLVGNGHVAPSGGSAPPTGIGHVAPSGGSAPPTGNGHVALSGGSAPPTGNGHVVSSGGSAPPTVNGHVAPSGGSAPPTGNGHVAPSRGSAPPTDCVYVTPSTGSSAPPPPPGFSALPTDKGFSRDFQNQGQPPIDLQYPPGFHGLPVTSLGARGRGRGVRHQDERNVMLKHLQSRGRGGGRPPGPRDTDRPIIDSQSS